MARSAKGLEGDRPVRGMLEMTVRQKFLMGSIGIVAGLGLTMLVLVRIVLYDSLYANLEKRGEFIAHKVAQDSVMHMLTERYFELQMMINDVKQAEDDIVFIFVQRDDGKVLAHTFEGGFPDDLRVLNGSGKSRSNGIRLLETPAGMILDFAASPFRGAGGKVHVGIAESPVRQEVNRTLLVLLGGLVGVVALGSGIAIPLSLSLTKPIHELSAAVASVERGDLSARVPVRALDEVGRLAAAFNTMAEARERFEDALRRSERKLRDIAASLGEGVQVVDLDGRLTFMNPEAERLLGWSEAELMGKNAHDIVHFRRPDGTVLPFDACPSMTVVSTGGRISVDEDIYIRKDGTEFPVAYISAPIFEDDNVVAVVIAFHDITRRKQREAERERLMTEHMNALSKVKVLSGMLPICSACKRIRDDEGYWEQIEAYIHDHSEADFSHGICPECAAKLYPQYFNKKP